MEESAIFDAVVDIVVTGSYDYYIYDLVPLGHALYYLSMAKVYDEWINKITKLRQEMGEYEQVANVMKRQKASEEDQILNELQYIKGRINASSSILTDRQKTAFYFVVVPEEMIILDTQKAAELFAKFDVPIAGYVVNRVLPTELAEQNVPEYLKNRITMQHKYLAQIDRTLGSQVLGECPSWSATSRACRPSNDWRGSCTGDKRERDPGIDGGLHGPASGPEVRVLWRQGRSRKTAMAGATAVWAAQAGKRTLLASTPGAQPVQLARPGCLRQTHRGERGAQPARLRIDTSRVRLPAWAAQTAVAPAMAVLPTPPLPPKNTYFRPGCWAMKAAIDSWIALALVTRT